MTTLCLWRVQGSHGTFEPLHFMHVLLQILISCLLSIFDERDESISKRTCAYFRLLMCSFYSPHIFSRFANMKEKKVSMDTEYIIIHLLISFVIITRFGKVSLFITTFSYTARVATKFIDSAMKAKFYLYVIAYYYSNGFYLVSEDFLNLNLHYNKDIFNRSINFLI